MRIFTGSDRINFLEETMKCLQDHDRTEADVLWVGTHKRNRRSETWLLNIAALQIQKRNFPYDDMFRQIAKEGGWRKTDVP